TRKWVLSRMAQKKYGDKVVNELVGKDGGPIQQSHSVAVDEKALNSILSKL
ncbi:terminase small subunit, partial [Enterobacter cloacae complex sp. 742-ADZ3-9B]